MRVILVVTDSDAMKEFERAFVKSGDRGFTIVPTVLGRGKTSLKAGDRVHPGGSSLLLTALADAGERDRSLPLEGSRGRRRARPDEALRGCRG